MFTTITVRDAWNKDNYTKPFQVFDYARLGLEFIAGHLPEAIHIEKSLVWTEVDGVAGMVPKQDDLARALGSVGADPQHPALVYDGGNGLYGARLAWALVLAGWKEVYLLEGGLSTWKQEKLPIKLGSSSKPAQLQVSIAWNDAIYARSSDVLERSKDTILLDTRTKEEFTGADRRSKRAGRIPGAIHWEWKQGLAEDGLHLKSPQELQAEFAKLGIRPDSPVITYCQSGVRAAHALYSLSRAGFTNIRNYDGSWEEWGNRQDLALEQGVAQ